VRRTRIGVGLFFVSKAEGGSLLPAAPTLPKLLLDQADVTAVSRQAYVAWF
jgi:hypothetical protein